MQHLSMDHQVIILIISYKLNFKWRVLGKTSFQIDSLMIILLVYHFSSHSFPPIVLISFNGRETSTNFVFALCMILLSTISLWSYLSLRDIRAQRPGHGQIWGFEGPFETSMAECLYHFKIIISANFGQHISYPQDSGICVPSSVGDILVSIKETSFVYCEGVKVYIHCPFFLWWYF